MKVLAVNGSPRKNRNTATLLEAALEGATSVGAQTELVHLRDLNGKGCASCFACKLKDGRFVGRCAPRDDLSPVLQRAMESDVVILGSPIYLGGVTAATKAFLERLVFPCLSYDTPDRTCFEGRIATGFIYAMGMPHDRVEAVGYPHLFEENKRYLELLGGPSEYVISADNYQFDDYARYAASNFDEPHKAAVRAERFPRELQAARAMGARLCEQAE